MAVTGRAMPAMAMASSIPNSEYEKKGAEPSAPAPADDAAPAAPVAKADPAPAPAPAAGGPSNDKEMLGLDLKPFGAWKPVWDPDAKVAKWENEDIFTGIVIRVVDEKLDTSRVEAEAAENHQRLPITIQTYTHRIYLCSKTLPPPFYIH